MLGRLIMRNCAKPMTVYQKLFAADPTWLVRAGAKGRHFSQTLVRQKSKGGEGGRPGDNFPLNMEWGKYKITAMFLFFFGVPLGAPCSTFLICLACVL